MPELEVVSPSLTTRQTEYVTFIREFTRLHGKAPAEAEIAQYFKVSAPSVHTMLVKLEGLGAIAREPRTARSIRVLIPPTGVPQLDRLPPPGPVRTGEKPRGAPGMDLACAVINELFVEIQHRTVDDEDFIPVLGAVARATGQTLLAAGNTEAEATRARRAVLEFAAESYARLCAMNDPEDADDEEDTRRFWDILGRERAR